MLQALRSVYLWIGIAAITAIMYLVGAPIFLVTWPFDPLRAVGHAYAARWGRVMFFLNPRWSCQLVGQEHVVRGRPYVVVSNHQGVADIMAMYHIDLHYKWISKASNFWVPFMGWFMFHAGYIPLRRGKKGSIQRCMEKARQYLDRGVSVLFFAEGTRSKDGVVLPFKVGAFKLAIDGQFDILPIGIGGTMNAIPKHSWKFSEERTPIKVIVGEPVSTVGLSEEDVEALTERMRQRVVELKADADARIAAELGNGVDPETKAVLLSSSPGR